MLKMRGGVSRPMLRGASHPNGHPRQEQQTAKESGGFTPYPTSTSVTHCSSPAFRAGQCTGESYFS